MRPLLFRVFDLQNCRFLRSGVEPFTPVLDLGAWQDESRWAISQFTGLKDRKGVEIWEGDIVRSSLGDTRPDRVFWQTLSFRLTRPSGGTHDFEWGMRYRIVGNQWENPELLT